MRSRHAHVELRFVGLAERFNRNADNDLLNRLALGRVTCHGQTLVDVQVSAQRDLALV
ncbi:MAG: hypothetical protein JO170_25065 [Verrucomicrobia bacterium]|nr:hypothetical protein [Verrucomicrobiota bacterium]